MTGKTDTTVDLSGVTAADIFGLWEVIRIYQQDNRVISYPWIKDRFKFNFMPEMMFICLRDGRTITGSWDLAERASESKKQYAIVLNESFEFIIIEISEDELILFDHSKYYLLVRRL